MGVYVVSILDPFVPHVQAIAKNNTLTSLNLRNNGLGAIGKRVFVHSSCLPLCSDSLVILDAYEVFADIPCLVRCLFHALLL